MLRAKNLFQGNEMHFLKKTIVFSVIAISTLSQSMIASDHPKGEIIASQSFNANFKHFKKVKFATFVDDSTGPMKVQYHLLRDGEIVTTLPEVQASPSWEFWEVNAISFKDLNRDGLKDIIIIAQYMTGIGPTGSRPFYVKDLFFQTPTGFVKDKEISLKLNASKNYDKLKTIRQIVSFLKK